MGRILITGGAGFIGSHAVDRFVRDGHEVMVLDNLDPQVHRGRAADSPVHIGEHVRTGRVRFLRGDVRSRADVEQSLDGVDTVVHLAAAVGVGQSMYEPFYYMDVNGSGQAMLMEVMAREPKRWRRFVVASSMSIYGEGLYRCPVHGDLAPAPRPDTQLADGAWELRCPEPGCGRTVMPLATPEVKPLQFTSIYAISKKVQEELALCFGRAYDIPTVALRFFNVYGSRQSLSNPYTGVAAIFMSRLKNGRPPLIFEDGGQSRDFIHVSDVAEAIYRAATAEDAATGAYNVCTGRPTTVREVAEVLALRLELDIAPRIVGKFRSGDIRHCIGDPTAAAEALGFRARVGLAEGFDELLAWAADEEAEDGVAASFAALERQGLVR
ncbi:MAG TPA: NAD-dependent epimerase/dehydratase family protein [Longimicrobiales bacterium]